MANLLTKDVKGTPFSPLEVGLIAASKIATEAFLSKVPFVGNGTARSGIMKMILGGVVGATMGRNMFGKAAATGLIVDAGEDLVRGLVGARLGSGDNGASAVGGNTANVGNPIPRAI